jgi:hypothetical protein
VAKASEDLQIFAKPAGALCNLDCKYCYYLDKAGQAFAECMGGDRVPLGSIWVLASVAGDCRRSLLINGPSVETRSGGATLPFFPASNSRWRRDLDSNAPGSGCPPSLASARMEMPGELWRVRRRDAFGPSQRLRARRRIGSSPT